LNAKPIINLWYYLVIYLTSFIPLSFSKERGKIKKRGFAPLRHPKGWGVGKRKLEVWQ
jgi:hypothetical protein